MILLRGIDDNTIGETVHLAEDRPCILLVVTDVEGKALRCKLTGKDARLLATGLQHDATTIDPFSEMWDRENQDPLNLDYGHE